MPFWFQRKTEQFQTAFTRILSSPFGFQLFVISIFVFFLTGFRPTFGWGAGQGFGVEFSIQDQQNAYALAEPGFLLHPTGVRTAGLEEILITNEDGTQKSILRPKVREKIVNYTVRSGDTLPKIAHTFGLQVRTLLWANNLTLADKISIGKEIRIPAMDGVFYKVQRGDSISDIANSHGITSDIVLNQNNLKQAQVLKVGQELFLPNAQRVFIAEKPPEKPKAVAQTPKTTQKQAPKKIYAKTAPASSSNGKTKPNNASSAGGRIANLSYKIIRPTKGVLTQGYHGGHLALDIAAGMNTPIYAAAPGKVITSQDGWNGGYGRYIIIDHGDGVHTLYGHNNVRKVRVGDWVEKGELIALMGNTGRVFGRTGIHLHFELRIKGRKVSPSRYF